MAERDYYEVLGLQRGASADEIRRAYRKLAREYHPDVNKSEDAATRFAELQEAYDVLSDAEKRKAYDRFGHAGVGVGQAPGGFSGGPAGSWSVNFGGPGGFSGDVDPAEFASMFDELFGRRSAGPEAGPFAGTGPFPGAGTRRPAEQARPARGRDVHHEITVAFMTAALGGTEPIRVDGPHGRQAIDVKIPAGLESGAQLRIKGQGEPGAAGSAPGDLILKVRVGRHPWFRRDGLDLYIDVPLTFAEATRGATIQVPLLQGSVELKVPSGASSGQKLRVRGRGVTDAKGRQGDFYAVVQIAAATDLSSRGRELLDELAPELKNPRDSAPWTSGRS